MQFYGGGEMEKNGGGITGLFVFLVFHPTPLTIPHWQVTPFVLE